MGERDIDRLFEELARSRGRSVGALTVPRPPAEEPAPEPGGREPGRRAWLFGALGAVVALSLIATAFSLISRGASTISADASDTTASVTTALAESAPTAPAGGGGGTAVPGTGTTRSGSVTAPAGTGTTRATPTTAVAATASPVTTAVSPTATAGPGTVTPDNPSGTIRWVVVKDHQLHLRGWTPSQEAANQTLLFISLVWGSQGLSNELVIDPSVPALGPTAVYIRDLVLFDPGSTELKPDFAYILDAGVRLVQFNPGLKIRIIARSNDAGNQADNTRLAGSRAQAVVDYGARFGIGPDKFLIDNRGDSDATGDAAAARNRSLEFQVIGTIYV